MRIFVTGATGYIGSAVVRSLVVAGHEVTGLVRSQATQTVLEGLGAAAVRGDYKDLTSFKAAALAHDAIVHVAMEYTPDGIEAGKKNLLSIIAEAKAAKAKKESAPRQVVFTSGVWVLGNTSGAGDESASTDRAAPNVRWRAAQEKELLAASSDAVTVAVIRPGMVYGYKAGFICDWFKEAEEKGAASFVGEGANHWSLIHDQDLAEYYRSVIEKLAGGVFHAVDGAPVTVLEAARAASHAAGAGGKTQAVPVEEARKTAGAVVDALVLDQRVSSKRAAELGWKPAHPSFVESAPAAYAEWKA